MPRTRSRGCRQPNPGFADGRPPGFPLTSRGRAPIVTGWMARPLGSPWRPPLKTESLGNIPPNGVRGTTLPVAVTTGFDRPTPLCASPGYHRGISSPGRGAIGAPPVRRLGSGRSPTAGARRATESSRGPQRPPPTAAAFERRRTAPPASVSTARRAGVSALPSAGQQGPSSRGSALGRRSASGLLPNTRLHRTGAQGSGLTWRGRAPILG